MQPGDEALVFRLVFLPGAGRVKVEAKHQFHHGQLRDWPINQNSMNNQYHGLFAAAFRAYLEEQGITQASVAQAAGMTPGSLHRYLTTDPDKESREPSIAVVIRLCASAGCRVAITPEGVGVAKC